MNTPLRAALGVIVYGKTAFALQVRVYRKQFDFPAALGAGFYGDGIFPQVVGSRAFT